MADLDDVPGYPLFISARGNPVNFKLVCDPVSKARYRKLIEKYGGEVIKCQGLPRLLLSTKTPCQHLHVGCEIHAAYTAAPVFNVTWVDHCISRSQLLDIKAYLLNPSPHFAEEDYMGHIDEGRYKPPPLSNPVPPPSNCVYTEMRVPFDETHERHIQEMKSLCSRMCGHKNLPDPGLTVTSSPASSDAGNHDGSTVDYMQRLSSQPSSTPRVPPQTSDNDTRIRVPASNLPHPQNTPNKLLALPLSRKKAHSVTDEPICDSEPPQLQPLRAQQEKVATSVNPVETQVAFANQQSSSTSNGLSLSNSTSKHQKEPKKIPRRRELFDSENFAPGFSDDESDPENMPRIPRPSACSPLTIDLGETIDIEGDKPLSPPPHGPQSSLPLSCQSPPRAPAIVQTNSRRGDMSQAETDSEFGPPPGSIVRIKGVRQNTRAPYSREEEFAILKYIKASKKLSGLRSNYIWREMDGKPGLERRTMHSLKEHFLKKMMSNLERFNIFTDDEIKKIRNEK